MKREIKFRGKRVDNGEWVYGYYVAYCVTGGGQLYHHIKNAIDTYKVDPDTIGQFTGLKDKNGKEIYEGDIVEFEWYDKMIGSEIVKHFVVFNEGEFRMKPLQSKQETWEIRLSGCNKKSEVISSIHENPELLNT